MKEPLVTERDTAAPTRPEFELGVLVVHGIGDQKQGATLTTWVDALSNWLGHRHTGSPLIPRVRRAVLRPNDGPAHVELNVRDDDDNQTWLFAEGWWASTFDPPTFGELWSWSFISVPATAAMHANAMVDSAVRRLKSARGAQTIYEGLRLVVMVLFLIGLVMLSPLILALLTLLLLAGVVASALPIDALRTAVAKAQLISIGTIGDTKRLIDSPTQSGAIKSPVADGIAWLREQGCEKIAIISHSQGAAVTYKALVDMANGLHGPVDPKKKIDSFISVGSGLPKVHALEHLSSPAGLFLRLASIAVPVSAVVGALSLRYLRIEDALAGLIAPALIFIATALVLVAFTVEIIRRGRHRRVASDTGPGWSVEGLRLARVGAGVVGLLATIVAALNVDQSLIIVIASAAIASGMTGVYIISSSEIPRIPHTLSTVVDRWVDLWASVDPVPAGPTRTVVPGRPETWRVTNLGSIARDHNSYADNDDECMTLIGTELLVQSGIATTRDLDEPRFQQNERRWRVGWRSFVAYMLTGAAAVFAWTTWRGADDALIRWYGRFMADDALLDTWFPGEIPGFVPNSLSAGAAEVISIIGYVVIGALAVQLGNTAWGAWNNSEARYELGRNAQMVEHRSETIGRDADHDRSVPATFRIMIGLMVFAWFIAIVPQWVWAGWQSLDLTSWRALGVISGAIGASLMIGTVLPRIIDALGIKTWAMSRDTSHIEGLIGYGKYQLHQGDADDAILSLRRAEHLSTLSGHANANAMGTLAKALAWKAEVLRRRGHDPDGETAWLEAEALHLYSQAAELPRQVTARNLIDYAAQLDVMGGAHVTVIDLLAQARRNFRHHPAVVIAAVAFDLEERTGSVGHQVDLESRIPTWDPADQLAGYFTLTASQALASDGRGFEATTFTNWPLHDHFEALLATGATAPLADLRPLLRRIEESGLGSPTKSGFSRLARRITSTVPPMPTVDLTQQELDTLAQRTSTSTNA